MVLAGIYLAYYGLNLVFDLLNSGERGPADNDGEDGLLHFAAEEPELIIPEEKAADEQVPQPVLFVSDGQDADVSKGTSGTPGTMFNGVASLKELFALAKDDLIEYTKAISY